MPLVPPCCRVISRAPGLKLVVETLISSLKPIGNIVLICCAFFIIFGILGVQVRGARWAGSGVGSKVGIEAPHSHSAPPTLGAQVALAEQARPCQQRVPSPGGRQTWPE